MIRIKTITRILGLLLMAGTTQAGNPDRIGEAGATHLLINPWARSTGWAGANSSSIMGIEAIRLNVAGLVRSSNNELAFTRTNWFGGAGININSFGFKAKLGDAAALGFSIMSFDMGEFYRTTEDFPDGTLGTFSPTYTNIGLSFAYAFSEQTSGGITVRMVSESIADMNAMGVGIDAGIQYQSINERLTLGFSLRNVGPAMSYSGDGVDRRATEDGVLNPTARTMKSRVAPFELPSVLNIGVGYKVLVLGAGSGVNVAANFMANSFGRDVISLGAEYSYKNMVFVRGGFAYEEQIFNEELSTNVASGPTFGATFQLPYGEGKTLGIDYSYRDTYNKYTGIHTLGVLLGF
ncbi:MAG: PorV/PorQ family protein [Bacteroidetes bacterium]|nr:PorV/PorQ family protein [Bacteroidota bacterium]